MEQKVHTEFVVDLEKARKLIPCWDDLARSAIEPNVFYESWNIIPALEHLKSDSIRLAFVYSAQRELIGFFPLETVRYYHGIPLKHHRLWRHHYLFCCTPLVRKGCESPFFQAIENLLQAPGSGIRTLSLQHIRADGPFDQHLELFLQQWSGSGTQTDHFERAALSRQASAENYLQANLTRKKRRELQRQKKRLSEQGCLRFEHLGPGDKPESWIDQFLAVEASGWKGRKNTAFANRDNEKEYFRRIVGSAHSNNQLEFFRCTLDEVPVAMKINFIGNEGSFAFKIAYDESFARYSPGVLLEIDFIHHFHRKGNAVSWIDSCATQNNAMINRLWQEKRIMRTVLLYSEPIRGRLLAALESFVTAFRMRHEKNAL